jgi:hypothetical protein
MSKLCAADPVELLETQLCLSALSKNLRGELHLLESEKERCKSPRCETLKTVHLLKVEVVPHDCDSDVAKALDGVFYVRDLVHAFEGGDGNNRGVHAGNFRWKGATTLATGTMSGITNVGTHREPIFDACQTCEARGYMEGRFCGSVVKARPRALVGCALLGSYRFRFDAAESGGEGAIRGTLEGAFMCPCQTKRCTDFRTFITGSYANPTTVAGTIYHVHDHTGIPTASAEIITFGAETGLNCGFRTDVTFGSPMSSVEITLLSGAAPATVDALSSGAVVASTTMSVPQHTPESLTLTATAIDGLTIHCPNNEVLLLELCTGIGDGENPRTLTRPGHRDE